VEEAVVLVEEAEEALALLAWTRYQEARMVRG